MKSIKGRHFLSLMDYSPEEIAYLLDLSDKVKSEKRAGIYKKRLLNKNVALLFEKPSTRTRCAFTVACADEGAHPEYLGVSDLQLGRKESVEDTARVLGRMFDGIQYRGFLTETLNKLAEYARVPVFNGLTDDDHPTQALADLMTIRERFGKLKNIGLTFVGDGRSNTCNALLIATSKMGMRFCIAAPKPLMPKPELVSKCQEHAAKSGATIRLTTDVRDGVANADVVYTDVWVSMGEDLIAAERLRLLSPYQVNDELMALAAKDAVIMHDLPAVKGYEVTEAAFERHADVIFEQSENRLHTIKAMMIATLAGDDS